MSPFKPVHRILVEMGAYGYSLTEDILRRLHPLPVEVTDPEINPAGHNPLNMDKKTLRLIPFKGEFLKPCPGTRGYICCGYQILNVGTNCPMDCSYCILQAYFNQPSLRVFVNLEKELDHIGQSIDGQSDRIFRIGTGEFTDSLALDHITGWSKILLKFFSGRTNAVLELKTKTDQIDGLISSRFRDRIIVSWSLNSKEIVSREEHGASSIKKRLQAAKKCQEEGFVIGFHFDPLVQYPEWKAGYLKTLELMDKYVNPKGIIWISLGCLRYIPALKPIIRKRHPDTRILNGEFIPGLDGKMRYFKPIRMEIYSFMKDHIQEWREDTGLYLCMESDEMWRKSIGWSPWDSEGLSGYLDSRVLKFFAN